MYAYQHTINSKIKKLKLFVRNLIFIVQELIFYFNPMLASDSERISEYFLSI